MIKKLLIVVVIVVGGFASGTQHFVHTIRAESKAVTPLRIGSTTGVVVLTGSSGRIASGVNLVLEHDLNYLLISGIGDGVSKNAVMRLANIKTADKTIIASRLTLGSEARNTKGNAKETLAWARAHALKNIILVTSDFHMPRALIEFKRAMPDYTFYPQAVTTLNGKTEWWRGGVKLLTIAREYAKYLAVRFV